ncbi:MAG: permease-like cell division protein FtsX [Armatimonadota bacterium]
MGLRGLQFVLIEAWTAMQRNWLVSLASVGNLAVSLIILGAFSLGAINLDHMASQQARRAVINVYLEDEADADTIETKLFGDLRVKETTFLSKEEALQELARMLGQDPDEYRIIDNPLPRTIRVHVNDPADLAAVAEFASEVVGEKGEVDYNATVTDQIIRLSHGVKVSGMVLGFLLAAAAMVIVTTTIRLTIYARRREIRIMQLVGATNWFIRGPLLFEGAMQGVVGGIISGILILLGYAWIHEYAQANLQFINLVYSGQFLFAFGFGTVLTGMFFGVTGALIGAHRYLKEV